ncbi:MAG: hypothetical protein HY327_00525, partial [Chloroflexi bacterium]|nr:hypothetical protein [Chloroflexota bacterium]
MKKLFTGRRITHLKEGFRGNLPFLATNPLPFFVVLFVLTIVNLIAQRLIDWQEYFVLTEIGFSVLALTMPWVAAFLYRKTLSLSPSLGSMIDLPSEDIARWFHTQVDFVFRNIYSYPVSVLFSLAAITTMLTLGIPWADIPRIIFIIFWGMFMLATGIVGWIYAGLLFFLYRLCDLNLKGAPFESLDKEFKNLNGVYLQIFLPGVFLYIGIVTALWASGGQWVVLELSLGRLWIFPIAGAVAGFFLASQYLIHRLMARSKEHRLDEIDKLVKETYGNWLADRSV